MCVHARAWLRAWLRVCVCGCVGVHVRFVWGFYAKLRLRGFSLGPPVLSPQPPSNGIDVPGE